MCPFQVATDTRLWLMHKLNEIRASLADLIRASVARAEQDVDVLMPGFTHLQPAMTVRWSHWLLGHAAAWQRDDMRLRDLMPRVAMLPLGSGLTSRTSSNCLYCMWWSMWCGTWIVCPTAPSLKHLSNTSLHALSDALNHAPAVTSPLDPSVYAHGTTPWYNNGTTCIVTVSCMTSLFSMTWGSSLDFNST